ncbi:MAG: FtsQ-type POTRA domain-containing protein [Bacilli bacterium]|jgi:cell division protein ftsQ|nr:FtsQ-type POTRA domain-containing protein [Bacilli bacterium]
MAKKIVKRKKLRVFRLLLLLFVIAIISFFVYLYVTTNTQNIIIKGNNYISDEEVLQETDLKNYPSFILTMPSKIQKKLAKNQYIKSVKVRRKFYHTFEITIKEYDVLFKNDTLNKYVLDNKQEIMSDLEFRVPRLVNYTPDKKYSSLIENMKSVDKSILGKISEISYQPNEFDKDRFLLLMDDGNSVYLTLTKFEMINYYNEVLGQLEGRRGILYLDSGNHFKIME